MRIPEHEMKKVAAAVDTTPGAQQRLADFKQACRKEQSGEPGRHDQDSPDDGQAVRLVASEHTGSNSPGGQVAPEAAPGSRADDAQPDCSPYEEWRRKFFFEQQEHDRTRSKLWWVQVEMDRLRRSLETAQRCEQKAISDAAELDEVNDLLRDDLVAQGKENERLRVENERLRARVAELEGLLRECAVYVGLPWPEVDPLLDYRICAALDKKEDQ